MRLLLISGLGNVNSGSGDPMDFGHAFIAKPFTTEALLNAVEQLLEGALASPLR